ncbi:hypothetical protein UO65_2028 [Actinokineospora spheciospongiae]|uniref:DUF397 domain-containing protein n=1 Tax=Actinokineospora spheciospongiae TaxID=909613 RepID=W7J190_9PSEU|nr:DUF397 domain-containing protein [Actinokineospora spheciospongiae]EWC62676.1 hypothetical protein UO65_2028 [Actinokineospora spheciospongiae]
MTLVRDTGWFKSARSGGANENCVEVRITASATGVRDTKNRTGGVLSLRSAAWGTFVTGAKDGRFDLSL